MQGFFHWGGGGGAGMGQNFFRDLRKVCLKIIN